MSQVFREAYDLCKDNPFADMIGHMSSLEKDKYTQMFEDADLMGAGFLTVEQAKKVFMEFGLSSQALAEIWQLVNLENCNVGLEQFHIAMYLINLARPGLLVEKLPFSTHFKKLRTQVLLIERKNLSEYIGNLKKKICENVKSFEKNKRREYMIQSCIQQYLSFIKKNKMSIEKMKQQIQVKQDLISRLQNLLEFYYSEICFSKEQYMNLSSHLDKPDSKLINLLSVASDEKVDVYKLVSDKKYEQKLRNDSLRSNFKAETLHSRNIRGPICQRISELRRASINELISSEEAYISDLQVIFEVFYDSIKKEDILSKDELAKVFLNLEDIVLCNKNFLRALKIRLGGVNESYVAVPMGDIILDHLQRMDPYIVYCSFQHRQAMLIHERLDSNSKFYEVHQRICLHGKTLGLSLNSFLLKPLQRITRYPLLIEKILSSTPCGCDDFNKLQLAKNKAVEFCNHVNEASRKQQNLDYLDIIQCRVQYGDGLEKLHFNSETNCLGLRKYLHSGLLYKVKNNRELMGLLFTDFLLLTSPSKPIRLSTTIINLETKSDIHFKAYKSPIFLNEMTIILDGLTDTSFKIVHKNKTFHLRALSKVERDSWIRNIDSASKCYLDVEKRRRTKADILKTKNSIGRLFVNVQEGIDLLLNSDDEFVYCKVKMGTQEQKSRTVPRDLNPKWNLSMQFYLFDIEKDVLHIEILAKKKFSRDVPLGWAEITAHNIAQEIRESKQPFTKHLSLSDVDSGEIIIKLDLQLYSECLFKDGTDNQK